MNKKALYIAGVVAALFTGGVMAGSIKVWSNGQTLTATDINGNFAHIHGLMVGGHGPRLVDGDVASNAAIATSKLAGKAGIAVAWGRLSGSPDGGTIAVYPYYGSRSTVTRTGTGNYTVNTTNTATASSLCIAYADDTIGYYAPQCACSWVSGTRFDLQCSVAGVSFDVPFKYIIYQN